MYEVGEGDRWWLRSPGQNNQFAAFIEEDGGDVFEGNPVNNKNTAVRPAFNLDLSSVLFTSADTADSGKPASDMDNALTAVEEAYTGNVTPLGSERLAVPLAPLVVPSSCKIRP